MPLYKRVAEVDHPGLFFIGFVQPLGPIMPIAEAQSEWVADLLQGRAALPSATEMRSEISAHEKAMQKRFVASKRHTIEVDFHPYLREIRRERKRSGSAGLTGAEPQGRDESATRPAVTCKPAGSGSECLPADPLRGRLWGPRGGGRGSSVWGYRRVLLGGRSASGAWLAHQTSQRAPRTGILRTTSRKKIGRNAVPRCVSLERIAA